MKFQNVNNCFDINKRQSLRRLLQPSALTLIHLEYSLNVLLAQTISIRIDPIIYPALFPRLQSPHLLSKNIKSSLATKNNPSLTTRDWEHAKPSRNPKWLINISWTQVPGEARFVLMFLWPARAENYHFDYDIAYNWLFCVGSSIATRESLISFGVLGIGFVVGFSSFST